MIDVIDSCDRLRFSMITTLTVSHQRRMRHVVVAIVGPRTKVGGSAVRHVLLICKEQAVNNILAIDVDGSHRSVRFGSREGMCACI